MTATQDMVELDARAVRASVAVVSLVQPADLSRATPCGDWTLAELLAHMTAQHYGFAAAAAGHGADLVRWQTGAPAADPVGEYAAAAERVLAAFAAADVLSREFALPQISAQLRFPAAEAWIWSRALPITPGVRARLPDRPDARAGGRRGSPAQTAPSRAYFPFFVLDSFGGDAAALLAI